jgi:hypothetical protein
MSALRTEDAVRVFTRKDLLMLIDYRQARDETNKKLALMRNASMDDVLNLFQREVERLVAHETEHLASHMLQLMHPPAARLPAQKTVLLKQDIYERLENCVATLLRS